MTKKTTKKKTTTKRWPTKAELDKARKLRQEYGYYVYSLSQKDSIESEAKKILRSIITDLKSATAKFVKLEIRY